MMDDKRILNDFAESSEKKMVVLSTSSISLEVWPKIADYLCLRDLIRLMSTEQIDS